MKKDKRWTNDPVKGRDGWENRVPIMAKMIPCNSIVLDIGCWRMRLEKHLPKGCTYIPCDIIRRDDRTYIADLNAKEFPELPPCDVAVLSGVLEYVPDKARVFQELKRYCSIIIVSYSDMTIIKTFTGAGWKCIETSHWSYQGIYKLTHNNGGTHGSATKLIRVQRKNY